MKVAIVGSRDFAMHPDTAGWRDFIDIAISRMKAEDYVVSGGADGADFWAEYYARQHRIGRIVHAADWAKYGKPAGARRNALIVRDAECVLAFYTDKSKSKGTKITVDMAKMRGIPVYEFDAAKEEIPWWLGRWYDEMAGLSGESQENPRHTEQPRG